MVCLGDDSGCNAGIFAPSDLLSRGQRAEISRSFQLVPSTHRCPSGQGGEGERCGQQCERDHPDAGRSGVIPQRRPPKADHGEGPGSVATTAVSLTVMAGSQLIGLSRQLTVTLV